MPLPSFILDPTSLLLGSLMVVSLLWWLSTRRPPGLPPGPGPALPLLGHLHLLDKDPRPKFREWRRQYGDVFSLYMGGQLVVVLNGYHVIKEALVKHADVFSDRPKASIMQKLGNGKGFALTSGSVWKEQRKVTSDILRELGMGRNILADRLQEEITHYITTLRSYRGAPVDVELITNASITNNICNIIFGKRYDYDDQRFVRCLKAAEENFMAFGPSKTLFFMPWLEYLPGDVCRFKTLLSTQATIEDLLMKQQLLDHLHNHTNGDASDVIHAYISEIRKREKSGQSTTINTDHLPQIFLGLFFGGSETTATAIRWALVFFLHNPDVQDKCYVEIQRVVGTERAPSMRDKPELTYLEATIMEVLRRANIVPLGLVRSTACDVMFRGHFIPKDTFVMYILESVLLDPGVWTEPLQFRPERFIGPDGKLTRPDEFIPFAVGPRMCIGQPLARMELFLYLATMIQHFRFLPPEDGQLPSLEGNLGLVHSPKPFQLRAVLRE